MSLRGREEARKETQYRERSTNNHKAAIPTAGMAKAKKLKKLKIAPKSANLFEILADEDKENNPPNYTIQIQIERKLMADPRNAEVGIPTKGPRKVNPK